MGHTSEKPDIIWTKILEPERPHIEPGINLWEEAAAASNWLKIKIKTKYLRLSITKLVIAAPSKNTSENVEAKVGELIQLQYFF